MVAWLKATFNAVPDVKRATEEPDPTQIFQNHFADLVVETWMGARLYVYVIEQEPKIKDLRNVLRQNTQNGIGTLFVLNGCLLPSHESLIKASEWQEALLRLHDGWIYAYVSSNDGIYALTQVHFDPTPYAEEYNCWHMPNFSIESVAVRHRENDASLRGQWAIGDIASVQFKRRVHHERINQRFHYATKKTQAPKQREANDKLDAYYQMLGIERNASEKEVKRAFRQMALRYHPDVSALPRGEAEHRIKGLLEAYDYIKEYHGWR